MSNSEGIELNSTIDLGASGETIKGDCKASLPEGANVTQIDQRVCNEVASESGDFKKKLISSGVCAEITDNDAVASALAGADTKFAGQTKHACKDLNLVPEVITMI